MRVDEFTFSNVMPNKREEEKWQNVQNQNKIDMRSDKVYDIPSNDVTIMIIGTNTTIKYSNVLVKFRLTFGIDAVCVEPSLIYANISQKNEEKSSEQRTAHVEPFILAKS